MTLMCLCPACGADLRGPAIPDEHLEHYGGHVLCRHGCGSPSHYSRLVGVYDRERDRTVEWVCPDCKHKTPR